MIRRLAFWILLLATLRVGGIWLGLNPKYRLGELSHVVSDSEPKLLLKRSKIRTTKNYWTN